MQVYRYNGSGIQVHKYTGNMKRQCLRSGRMKTLFPNIVDYPLRGLFIKSIY